MKQIFNKFKQVVALLALGTLISCGSGANCLGSSGTIGDLTLALTAPNQFPAGVAVTAYLTMTNTSSVNANNLLYAIPAASNYTGTVITVVNGAGNPCLNIAIGKSCTFPVVITNVPVSHPGSFTVTATPNGSSSSSTPLNSFKAAVGLQSATLSLTANIGLTTLAPNSQAGANGLSFLYAQTVAANPSGATLVSIVAVVNSATAGVFNTINLTDAAGTILSTASVVSGNSGTGLANLSQNTVVSFLLAIPAGATSYSFYAQTMENGTRVNTGANVNTINLVNATAGVLQVQPSNFVLSPGAYESQTITYTNIGTGTISNLSIAAPLSPVVKLSTTCGATLAAGANCIYILKLNGSVSSLTAGSISANYLTNNESVTVLAQYTIDPAAQVTAQLSSTSSGESSISTLAPNTDFYAVFKLVGGANFLQSYSVTLPSGSTITIPGTSNCQLTSIAPRCSVKLNSGVSNPTATTINFTGNNPAPTPTSAALTVAITMLWTVESGLPGTLQQNLNAYAYNIAVAPDGSSYLAGNTSGSLFAPLTGASDYFIAKYNTSGALVWGVQAGSTGGSSNYNQPAAISQDTNRVYMVGAANGALSGQAYVGPNSNYFLVSYDLAGNLICSAESGVGGGPNDTAAYGVSHDGSGNIYLGGYTSGSLAQPIVSRQELFLAKYDSSCNRQWIIQQGALSNSRLQISSVATDTSGNTYATGTTTTGYSRYFVAKYSADGVQQWFNTSLESAATLSANAISIDGAGNSYITGITNISLVEQAKVNSYADGFIAKYDTAGSLVWIREFGVSGYASSSGVGITNNANGVYISGNNVPQFGAYKPSYYFLAAYSLSGVAQWESQVANQIDPDHAPYYGGTNAGGIAVDALGDLYISGATIPGLAGQTKYSVYPYFDYFVAKWQPY